MGLPYALLKRLICGLRFIGNVDRRVYHQDRHTSRRNLRTQTRKHTNMSSTGCRSWVFEWRRYELIGVLYWRNHLEGYWLSGEFLGELAGFVTTVTETPGQRWRAITAEAATTAGWRSHGGGRGGLTGGSRLCGVYGWVGFDFR